MNRTVGTDKDTFFKKLQNKLIETNESRLFGFATRSSQATRLAPETADHRNPFALDRDRILYSSAFRRYSGKTQVIFFASQRDEMLSSRSIHTLSVAQISRTIGTFLRLNEDLIEAIALGHDLGHSPFGHDGERFLSQLCQEHEIGEYHHHIQSLHIVDRIAKRGRGLNLTFQVRDGILSHDGEVHHQTLRPVLNKDESTLLKYIEDKKLGRDTEMMPVTLEGCVVRISDTIAYIGQDIEDAIRIGLIKRKEIPNDLQTVLGSSSGEIISTLVKDVVYNSYQKPEIHFSSNISDHLLRLKKFNYEKIYHHPKLKKNHQKIKLGFKLLFDRFMTDLDKNNKESRIFHHFLDYKESSYLEATCDAEKVRDFIAGMTDRYFVEVLQELVMPDMT
jgi:dGTPase